MIWNKRKMCTWTTYLQLRGDGGKGGISGSSASGLAHLHSFHYLPPSSFLLPSSTHLQFYKNNNCLALKIGGCTWALTKKKATTKKQREFLLPYLNLPCYICWCQRNMWWMYMSIDKEKKLQQRNKDSFYFKLCTYLVIYADAKEICPWKWESTRILLMFLTDIMFMKNMFSRNLLTNKCWVLSYCFDVDRLHSISLLFCNHQTYLDIQSMKIWFKQLVNE